MMKTNEVLKILEAIFFLFVGSSVAQSKCLAVGCVCNDTSASQLQDSRRNFTVNCRGRKLLVIPRIQLEFVGSRVTAIDLGNNSIHALQANVFSNQTNLRSLILDHNYIEDVSVASFNVNSTGESNLVSPLELINLTNNHLHRFPACFGRTEAKIAAFDNLKTLLIGENLFGAHLEMDSFAGIRNLRKLEISRCLIRVVSDLTFKMLPRLEFLDLSQNSIHEMSHMIFAQDAPLQTLKMQENQLTEFPKNLPNRLKNLDLSSNSIERLHRNEYPNFCRLKNLQILDLSNNKIVYVLPGIFNSLSQLLYMDLSKNRIETIEERTFDGLSSLKFLFLHNNPKLVQMADFSIATLPQLQHLFLHQCLLETLSLEDGKDAESKEVLYPPLKNLWLFGNPLTCDCKMLPLVRFLKRQNVNLDASLDRILADLNGTNLREKLSNKLSKINKFRFDTMCTKPLNRHHNVVGIPLLEVSESYLNCPDEPMYIAISCFLGIIAFLGVIPIVFVLILTYLFILRFVQTHFGCAKEKED